MTEANHGLEQAKAQFDDIKEMVEAVNNEKLTDEQREDAQRACWLMPRTFGMESEHELL